MSDLRQRLAAVLGTVNGCPTPGTCPRCAPTIDTLLRTSPLRVGGAPR